MSDNKKTLEAWERVAAYAIDMCSLSGNASTTYAIRKDIETILSALKALRDENKRLRDALEFYADPNSYRKDMDSGQTDIYNDRGQRAQQAINPKGE